MSVTAHLNDIQTLWTQVRRAHTDDISEVRRARSDLLQRYGTASWRYLMGALRDKDAADEVYQEFSLRLIRGDFHNAAPEKGRFRSFIKSVLYRMVIDYHRGVKRNASPYALESHLLPAEPDHRANEFDKACREMLLAETWEKLAEAEQRTGKLFYSTLKLRAEYPEARSPALAVLVSDAVGKEVSVVNLRVMVHRAREMFGHLLIQAVLESIDSGSREDVEEELAALGLLHYCGRALERLSA